MAHAGEPRRETPGGGAPTPDERAYAEYLDAILRGATEDLDAFLGRHPLVSEALRSRLEALQRMLAGDGDPAATGSVPVPAAGDLPFERIGDFRLIRRLGQGGMGVVYLAEQGSLRRLVALKVLRSEHAGAFEAGTRFEREVQAIAKLRHPNIVTVFANGEEKGIRYFAMELVPGKGLDERLREAAARGERLPIPTVLRWVVEIARALECAHGAGIVHRDVKPSNVRIAADGRATLVDFGLARDVRAATLTVTGEFRGTPYYASPEQVAAKRIPIDARTDVYSLGVTLFECVTGRVPFEGETTEQIFHQILVGEPPAPRRLNASIPRDLETVILKAIEKDPDRRYATAGAFGEDLEALLEVRPIRARPAGAITRAAKWSRRNPGWTVGLAACLLALLAVPAAYLHQRRRAARERARESVAAIEEARRAFAEYGSKRDEAARIEGEIDPLRFAQRRRFLEWEEERLLMEGEDRVRALRRGLQADMESVASHLGRAERLDPERIAVRELRAELYLERWRDALRERDPEAAARFARLVAANDADGRHAATLHARGTLTLTTDPPGAAVYLFRYREQAEVVEGGEPRLVPVPVGDPSPAVPPGTWALRVVKGAGEIEEEDLILRLAGYPIEGTVLVAEGKEPSRPLDRLVSIGGQRIHDQLMAEHFGREGEASAKVFEFERAGKRFAVEGESLEALGDLVLAPDRLVERGGVPADVHHLGEVRSLVLPPGLRVRTTAAPLLLSPACRVGASPLADLSLEEGSYLALLRLEGHEDQRYPFRVERGGSLRIATVLNPAGTTPEGLVFVPGGPFVGGGDPNSPFSLERTVSDVPPFWILERELTRREYLSFLNDPGTLAEIEASEASGKPIRYPRDPTGWKWSRDPTGRFVVPRTPGTTGPNPFYPATHDAEGFPIAKVGFGDGEAYARWRTEKDRPAGSPLAYGLPIELEWEKAGRGADERLYPYGNPFVQKWMRSRYTRRGTPTYNPPFSYPIDESPYGAFDMGGNLPEYCAGVLDSHLPLGVQPYAERLNPVNQLLRGGSWEFADPFAFRVTARRPVDPTFQSQYGIRLVARPAGHPGR
ncbi:MAG: bifunctional serine/threonine-protein kinase/formylglycine-generating enzyme family protein [Planctomycetes bacterium]|nr:bifunctional serine/threonine-protein kinase/formylglycine-generating enzyme family protein [Planctomycetota bacterium]